MKNSFVSRAIPVLLVFGFAQHALATETPKDGASVVRLENTRIDAIDTNFTSVTVTDCPQKCDGVVKKLSVSDTLRGELKAFHKGDHLRIDIDSKGALQSIAIRSLSVSSGLRFVVLAITGAACFFLTALITWWHPLKLIIGVDRRYSNSQFQMAVWFGVVIATYLATIYLRISEAGWDFASVSIPQNLLLLSGMSALTFGGAKGITTAKVNTALAAAAPGAPNPKPPGQPHFWKDLTQNDVGVFDLGDFQMFVVTLVAVAMYLTLIFNFLGSIEFWKTASLPDVDTTILAAFGLGHGAYLTKKAAGNPGTS